MLSFTTDELVRVINQERVEEARKVRPHTDARPPDQANPPRAVEENAYILSLGDGRRGRLGA